MAVRENAEAKGKIRVLIGEDSAFMRRVIADALDADPGIEVVGTAANGREVLRKLVDLRPDCVTLDLEMPRMDGLETLRFIMSEWPTPVVILSGHTAEGARMALTCLEYGAVDFVSKTFKGMRFPVQELISKVKLAATVDAGKVRFAPVDFDLKAKTRPSLKSRTECVVCIGASTGGPQALGEVIPRLPADLPASVVVVQHMPSNFTTYLAERLDARSSMYVMEAEDNAPVRPGSILVAPGGRHILMDEKGGQPVTMLLRRNEKQRTACPSIDFALTSIAPIFKRRLISVILTGMGRDGEAGCDAVRKYGGRVICQDRETSMIFGMPGAVVSAGLAHEVLPVQEIADCIVREVEAVLEGVATSESQ
jgi:two-component system chemotaxis response regulator CheB